MFTIIGVEAETGNRPVPEEIQHFVQPCAFIEELVFEALIRRYQLRFGAFGLASEGIMCVRIERSPLAFRKETAKVWLKADVAQLRGCYSWQPLNETVHDFADQDGYVVEADWFARRDKRLKIK